MRLIKSFLFAFKGLVIYFRSGGNLIIHCVAAVIVVIMGFYFKISSEEWILLVICIGMVLGAEAINTSIEELTNLVSPDYNEQAGKVKDLAAAAVLIIAIATAIIGLIIFLPKILNLFG